jgi:hypothetical protein
VAILRFLCGSPRRCRVRTASFCPRWHALIYTGCMSGFMGTGKPSSPVTTSPNRISCFEVVCWRRNEAPGWQLDWVLLGAKTSSWEQGTNFDLVETSQMVVIRENLEVTCTMCWSGSFPCRVYIDSSRGDTLGYEWPLVRCYHLVLCLMYYWCLEDEDGYGYIIMITVITLPLTLTWVNILLVYVCSSL